MKKTNLTVALAAAFLLVGCDSASQANSSQDSISQTSPSQESANQDYSSQESISQSSSIQESVSQTYQIQFDEFTIDAPSELVKIKDGHMPMMIMSWL